MSQRRYRTIVADPPWEIGRGPEWASNGTSRPLTYSTMSVDQIAALPVDRLAAPTCELYLWTINAYVEQSYGVARGWGFEPVCLLTWCKPPRGLGLGGKFPSDTEFVLHCAKTQPRPNLDDELRLAAILREAKQRTGKTRREIDEHFGSANISGHWFTPHGDRVNVPTLEQWAWLRGWLALDDPEIDALVERLNERKGERVAPPLVRAPGRWFQWPRGAHSEKPEAFLDLVEQVSPGPYVELFARRDRLGWDTWGNESLGTAEMAA